MYVYVRARVCACVWGEKKETQTEKFRQMRGCVEECVLIKTEMKVLVRGGHQRGFTDEEVEELSSLLRCFFAAVC